MALERLSEQQPVANAFGRREQHPHIAKTLALASLGSMLEYYDFIVYSFVAPALSQAFFPPDMPVWLKNIQVLAIYALGYLLRPIAGTVIGHYSDRVGRKKLFMVTIMMMALSTFAMSVLPTYSSVGWAAPVLLLTCRLLQGCSVGGEVTGAIIFVAEHAPPRRVGLCGAILLSAINFAFFLGTGAAGLSTEIAGTDPAWQTLAWRLPFFIGGVFGLISLYMRRALHETPAFLKLKEARQASPALPLMVVLSKYKSACLIVLALTFVTAQTTTLFFQFVPTFLGEQYSVPRVAVLNAITYATFVFALIMPFWGWLSDALGYRRALAAAAVVDACAVTYFFLSLPLAGTGVKSLTFGFVLLGIAASWGALALPIAASLFPTDVRFSGVASSYNVGIALFVGTSPLLMAALAHEFGVGAPLVTTLFAAGVLMATAWALRFVRLFLGATAKTEDYGLANDPT